MKTCSSIRPLSKNKKLWHFQWLLSIELPLQLRERDSKRLKTSWKLTKETQVNLKRPRQRHLPHSRCLHCVYRANGGIFIRFCEFTEAVPAYTLKRWHNFHFNQQMGYKWENQSWKETMIKAFLPTICCLQQFHRIPSSCKNKNKGIKGDRFHMIHF